MNAGYYFITLMQGSKHMLAPNKTYDSIAGTKPGEACAVRDLPMELSCNMTLICVFITRVMVLIPTEKSDENSVLPEMQAMAHR